MIASTAKNHVVANAPDWWRAKGGSFTGLASARALARIGAAMAGGGALTAASGGNNRAARIISEEGARAAHATNGKKMLEGINIPMTLTAAGWATDRFDDGFLGGWVGWGGAGGSIFVWNPAMNASFAYLPTRHTRRIHKARGRTMLKALERCLAQEALGM